MLNDFLTTGELCDVLGISLSSVYKISQKNLLPKYRPLGRKVYFKKQEVEAFINKNRIASIDELNAQLDRDELVKGRAI